jgi:hypothetical protein
MYIKGIGDPEVIKTVGIVSGVVTLILIAILVIIAIFILNNLCGIF